MTRRLGNTDGLLSVGPRTVTGSFLRQFWIPCYTSRDLERDGPVARVRLLGEDLVAFRDSSGRVGLVEEHCPHRGASLFLGRNEEHGLRCVWHGWKFDATGSCVEMPNEPPSSRFKEKVGLRAYPCQERNGLVWAFLGDGPPPADLPLLEFNLVPADHVDVTLRVQECSYMQGIEGEYDSSHALILHQGLPGTSTPAPGSFREKVVQYRTQNRYPKYQALDTEYGVLIGARYDAEPDSYYWRIYPFMMPFYTVINVDPSYESDELLSGHAWVPMDDAHTLVVGFTWHPSRPLTDGELRRLREGPDGPGSVEGLHPTDEAYRPRPGQPYAAWWTRYGPENDYGFDFEAQRDVRWSGVPGLWVQDTAVQSGRGPIPHRDKEHLGSSDLGQLAIRRRMWRAAVEFDEAGAVPSLATKPELFSLRPIEAVLPRDVDRWQDAIEASMREATAGVHRGPS